ncbi:Formyl-coenzyme A transferase [Oligella ureolytica]|uniref:CoA transferase n=1 Tax=Oligella ureolytica TaxID=90244 RepID=A0A378XH81_9BURK|nr:CoA transferase [Oligella ureolytica]QPT41166.1 CoA transferase [Oligella ureolytica]SUA53922.1 Formyl-coenzyme A transferase [Oligella ureolytica]SUA55380.1 Formyl-coenzyme A transferase [Oligella ureolytica]
MNMQENEDGALRGIKVIDLTTIIFGPYASLILADYGADVIKIEAPNGDSTRNTGPCIEKGLSTLFLGVNRNKRSVVLDLKRKNDLDALYKLVATADVFMHSIRPQKMEKLGLDPKSLMKLNPKLVYAALHGFGNGGSYAGQPAYDDTIQGLSGIADLVGQQTGTPRYLPTIAADKTSALFAAHGILAAIIKRQRTGQGQFVEIPMYESMVSYLLVEHLYGHHLPEANEQIGYPRVLSKWRKPYATSDGYICMMPYTDAHWKKFFSAIGRKDLADADDFKTISARTSNIDKLYELTESITKQETNKFWLELCHKLEIPVTPINSIKDLEQDRHLQDVGLFIDIKDEQSNKYTFTRNPVLIKGSSVKAKLPPKLGEHTAEVLRDIGLSKEEIDSIINR